jgi:hypothetical protein
LLEIDWERSDAIDGFSLPGFGTREGLELSSAAAGVDVFGYWQTRLALDPLPAGRYRIRAKVRPTEGGSPEFAELRLRAFTEAPYRTAMTVSDHFALGNRRNMSVFFDSDGVSPWRLAIDLLDVEATRGGALRIESIVVIPLP